MDALMQPTSICNQPSKHFFKHFYVHIPAESPSTQQFGTTFHNFFGVSCHSFTKM